MKFFCIADEDTVRGFGLAGVAGQVVTTPAQAAAALEAATAAREGIILITEKVASGIRNQVDVIRLEHDSPLIVEISGPEGPSSTRKTLRRFIQEAVGIPIGGGDTS